MALSQTQKKRGYGGKSDGNPTKRAGRGSGKEGAQSKRGYGPKDSGPVPKKGGSVPKQTQEKRGVTGRGDSAAGVSPKQARPALGSGPIS